MQRILKRRTRTDSAGKHERLPAAHPSNRRGHHRTFFITIGIIVFAFLVFFLYFLTHTANRAANKVLTDAAWLNPTVDGRAWQSAMHEQSLQNTPASHGLALQQVFFISCNRHDRSQAYWANLAVAAQCELLSDSARAAATPCRRLYAGLTPLSRTGGVLTEEKQWVPETEPLTSLEDVPFGACGSVYDSTAAAQHRAYLLANTKKGTAKSPASLRFPVSPLKADPVPLDAVLWLGDAIYADKRADGQDRQALLTHHVNSLAEVGRFWRIQRDAPEYNAFVSSCVALSSKYPTSSSEPRKKSAAGTPAHDNPEDQSTITTITTTGTPTATQDEAQVKTLGQFVGRDNDDLAIPQPPAVAGPLHNVWGTWDDHDMGKNDGGKEYPYRNVTQRFFLDFLKAPASDPRWTREGVYEAYTLPFHAVVDDAKGWGASIENLLNQLYEHAFCVILLDARSFRDPPNATYSGDMLGAAQWAWFEAQLQRFTTRTDDGREACAVILIGSGIQFMLDEKPAENWAAFPGARDRLLGLLRIYRTERVAFLTGDVHLGELGGDFTAHTIRRVLGYPLLEATSSGLTHSANMFFLPTLIPIFFPSPRRLSLYVEKNFGAVRLSVDLLHLPALRPYLNPATKPLEYPSLFDTAKERQAVRHAVQCAINVTFTTFSIPQHGQPVHRLNFPLSMLTYAHGPTYLDAVVNPVSGDVHLQNPTEAAWKSTDNLPTGATTLNTFTLRNGTVVAVAHYPTTSPVPFVTWYTRVAQRYIFTHSSVSVSLKWCLMAQVCAGLLMGIVFIVRVGRRVLQHWRQRSQQWQCHPHPNSPLLSRNGERHSDTATFAQSSSSSSSSSFSLVAPMQPRRWWNEVVQPIQKDKKR